MIIFKLNEFNLTYDQMVRWTVDNGIDVYAVASYGANDPSMRYMMEEADMVAFKLAYGPKDPNIIMGYKGKTTVDSASFYCPYIPLFKHDDDTKIPE